MWSFQHEHETRAPAESVFAIWADVAGWPGWDDSLIATTLDGPFAAGATGTLHPDGAPEPLPFAITSVDPGRGFSDETHLGPVILRFVHDAAPSGGGARITVRVEVDGPGDAEIGVMVTSALPESVTALARAAESLDQVTG